jgi:hypothetical protein
MVLIADDGTEVFDRAYSTQQIAKQSARKWVQANYEMETEEVSSWPVKPDTLRKRRARNLGPQPTHLVQMMRDRADDNEEKAIQMRASADGLEAEAKRLREAADSLEGPDGKSQST